MDSSQVIGFYVRLDRPRGYMRGNSYEVDIQSVEWAKPTLVKKGGGIQKEEVGDEFWMGKEWGKYTGSFDSSQPYIVY